MIELIVIGDIDLLHPTPTKSVTQPIEPVAKPAADKKGQFEMSEEEERELAELMDSD